MNKDPLERELEFRRSIEESARARREARPGRRVLRSGLNAVGRRVGLFVALTIIAAVAGFFTVIFGIAVKWTDAYACSMAAAGKSPVVIAELGEPLDAGFFAWSFSYIREGSTTDAYYSTALSGPKGNGTLRVQFYRSPVGSALNMNLEKDGLTQSVHRGPVVCP